VLNSLKKKAIGDKKNLGFFVCTTIQTSDSEFKLGLIKKIGTIESETSSYA
jgi:hypothetical protein